MQLIQNPEITGTEYQHGELAGWELRSYLLLKYDYRCAYCGKQNTPFELDHRIPRSRGGSSRTSNLVLACHECNQVKANQTAAEFGHPDVAARAKVPLKDAAAVNATRFQLVEVLRCFGLPIGTWSGGRTSWNRARFGLGKTHALDALAVGQMARVTVGKLKTLQIIATGRGQHCRTNFTKEGFPYSSWQPARRTRCLPSWVPLWWSAAKGMYTQGLTAMFVPVIDSNQQPLMPTTPARARRWIESGKATPFWKREVFCVRLNVEPSARNLQPVAVGIDPGSKKEGYSVVSAAHTYLNVQADTPHWVKDAVAQRRRMRRARRNRKTPCRQPCAHRLRATRKLPPSTKARWQWKLRVARWLGSLFPVAVSIVEDIKAATRGKRQWDQRFSPLEVGKHWFYTQLAQLAPVHTKQGWQMKELREALGLKKSGKKMAEAWNAHCIDAWVLARSHVGGQIKPDNMRLVCITPLQWHRRQLHRY